MNFKYNADYFPPAPYIELHLAVPDRAFAVGPLPAFVDSGADATIVPYLHMKALPIKPTDRKWLRSQWGERRQIRIFTLDVGIADIRLPGVDIVEDEKSDEIIIGRNVLNMLRVFLDGPNQMLSVTE